MRKSSIMVGVGFLLLCLIPQVSLAQGHGFGKEFGMKSYRMLFTDEQNKQLDSVMEKFRKDIMPLRKTMMQQHQELQAMMRDASVAESALKAQVMKGAETVSQMVVKRAEMLRAARKIATPEQLAKIDAYQAKQMQERAKWMERWEKTAQAQ